MSRGIGTAQQKILLLLLGGLALGLSSSPARYFRILRAMRKEWKEIDRRALYRAIRTLYQSKLVRAEKNRDGTTTLVLSENGKRHALTFKLDNIEIKTPKIWDGQWRIVVFDIPERRKRIRDSLRFRLKQLDFYELQKSVFVHPYPCSEEVEFLVEFYDIRPYVRQILAGWLDNELHLKQKFGLL